MKKLFILLPAIILTLFLFSIQTNAQSLTKTIMIIDLAQFDQNNGEQSIEIMNVSDTTLNINGWYFKDNGHTCDNNLSNKINVYTDSNLNDVSLWTDNISKLLKPNETMKFYFLKSNEKENDNVFLCKKMDNNQNYDNYADNIQYCKALNTGYIVKKDENLNTIIIDNNGKDIGNACESLTTTPSITPTIEITQTPFITPTISLTPLPTEIPENYSKLRINEVQPFNISYDNDKWVELVNTGDKDISLLNVYINNFKNGICNEENKEIYSLKSVLEKDNINDFIIKPNQLLKFNFPSLIDNGDAVELTQSDGTLIDSIKFNSCGGLEILNTMSIGRYPDGDNNAYQLIPTPGTINIPIRPIDYRSWNLFLSEIYPTPATGLKSWIEIYNADTVEHDLYGWVLDNTNSSSKLKIFSTHLILQAKSYTVVYSNSSIFNNNGDEINFIAPDGSLIQNFVYSFTQYEYSWIYVNKTWILTSNITPDAQNPQGDVLGSDNQQIISIKEAKELGKNSFVTVQGTVTVDPEILDKNYFYIQDNSAGIRIDYDTIPKVKIGDFVKVSGILRELTSVKKITITNIEKLGSLDEPSPQNIKISEVNESNEGKLVKISGIITKNNSNTLEVSDNTGKVTAIINSSTQIKKPYVKIGDFASITGIESQDSTKDGVVIYRILPRYQSDIIVKESTELADTGVNSFTEIGFGVLILMTLFIILRTRKVNI